MQVGDLVASVVFEVNPVGLVEQVWKTKTKCLVRVLWGNGKVGNYYARELEILCK